MDKIQNTGEASFNSKILLFGEYGIIQNSMGLSIPYNSFKGELSLQPDTYSKAQADKSNKSLKKYVTYLKDLKANGELLVDLDIDGFEKDVKSGMIFESTIPEGFGVGSSGALVAAIYDSYAADKIDRDSIDKDKLAKLKNVFGQLESYFHGTSSGIDPLICYVGLPVLIENRSVGTVELPEAKGTGNGAIFLLDTGRPGRTQPLVEYFLDKCKEKDFTELVKQKFIPYNDGCIKDFLKGETKSLFTNLYFLSKFLLEHLTPMVPKLFRKVWEQGLESGAYYLKLCGSGGGGFILGFTEDLDKAQPYLKDHEITVIQRF